MSPPFGLKPVPHTRGDEPDFDPAVVRGAAIDKIRILPVFKVQRDVLKKSGLVVFDGEVVMSVALVNQVGGDLALSSTEHRR